MIGKFRIALLLPLLVFCAAAEALQPGDVITLEREASLVGRPVADSSMLVALPAGTPVKLVTRTTNASGAWWFVQFEARRGWLEESALGPAAPAARTKPSAEPTAPAPATVDTGAVAEAASRTPQVAPIAAGSREVEFTLDLRKEEDASALATDLRFGYFTSARHELGLGLSYAKTDDFRAYGIGPFYTYNLPSAGSDVVPFMGLSVSQTRVDIEDFFLGDFSIRGPQYGATLGFRVFAGRNLSVNIAAYYERQDLKAEADGDTAEFESTAYGLRVGLSGFLHD